MRSASDHEREFALYFADADISTLGQFDIYEALST